MCICNLPLPVRHYIDLEITGVTSDLWKNNATKWQKLTWPSSRRAC